MLMKLTPVEAAFILSILPGLNLVKLLGAYLGA